MITNYYDLSVLPSIWRKIISNSINRFSPDCVNITKADFTLLDAA